MSVNIKYELVPTKDSFPSLIVFADGKPAALHSRMFPSREAAALEAKLAPIGADICVVLGVGLGYHLAPLEKYSASYSQIILIDILPDIERLLEKGPCGFLLGLSNVHFLGGMSPEQAQKRLLELIELKGARGIKAVAHPASLRIFNGYYSEIMQRLSAVIDKKAGDIATANAFAGLYVKNCIENISRLEEQKPVKGLFGKFKGLPAAVLSTGPTAEASLEMLKALSNKIFIIAVDSALSVCRGFGIEPDFAVSVDPQPFVAEHLSAGLGRAELVTSVSAYAGRLKKPWKGDVFCSLNSHPFAQLIEERFPGILGSTDSATGSVSGDALAFALRCGFSHIACIGFDFGFKSMQAYCRETVYQRRYAFLFADRFKPAETLNLSYIMSSSGALRFNGFFTRKSFLRYRDGAERAFAETESEIFHIEPMLSVAGWKRGSMKEFGDSFCTAELGKASLIRKAADSVSRLGGDKRRELTRLLLNRDILRELLRRSSVRDSRLRAYERLAEKRLTPAVKDI